MICAQVRRTCVTLLGLALPLFVTECAETTPLRARPVSNAPVQTLEDCLSGAVEKRTQCLVQLKEGEGPGECRQAGLLLPSSASDECFAIVRRGAPAGSSSSNIKPCEPLNDEALRRITKNEYPSNPGFGPSNNERLGCALILSRNDDIFRAEREQRVKSELENAARKSKLAEDARISAEIDKLAEKCGETMSDAPCRESNLPADQKERCLNVCTPTIEFALRAEYGNAKRECIRRVVELAMPATCSSQRNVQNKQWTESMPTCVKECAEQAKGELKAAKAEKQKADADAKRAQAEAARQEAAERQKQAAERAADKRRCVSSCQSEHNQCQSTCEGLTAGKRSCLSECRAAWERCDKDCAR